MGGQAVGNAVFQVGKELWNSKPGYKQILFTNTFIQSGGGPCPPPQMPDKNEKNTQFGAFCIILKKYSQVVSPQIPLIC